MLKQWAKSTNKNFINESKLVRDSDFFWLIHSGVDPFNKKDLKKFEKTPRQLSNRKIRKTERLKLIQSPSGTNLIQLIALPCIEYLEQNAY